MDSFTQDELKAVIIHEIIHAVYSSRHGFPYSPTELVKLFADIRCRADAAYEKATGEKA